MKKEIHTHFKLRAYQQDISERGKIILDRFGMLYLSMEVRTGKTHVALSICQMSGFRSVLFVTKKKAIQSIKDDHIQGGYSFKILVINYESAHKIDYKFDAIICDEAHSLGAFPKPSLRAKTLRGLIQDQPIIYLSGTPTPESYSQIYHQFYITYRSPFSDYSNFYKWAHEFVRLKTRYLGAIKVPDYSDAREADIKALINHLFISYTQKEAGFDYEVEERFLIVPMKQITYKLIERLKNDRVIQGSEKVILADTNVKLMGKIHQLSSGTIKFEDGTRATIDDSKAVFIRDKFKGQKIAIIYKFIQEGIMLREVFPKNTASPEDFNESDDLTFIGQVQSSREGVNLSSADVLIFFNIDFSAVSYFQAKDRMTSKTRTKDNTVYWCFSDAGIERKIYLAVKDKKDYTLKYFKKDYNIKTPKI